MSLGFCRCRLTRESSRSFLSQKKGWRWVLSERKIEALLSQDVPPQGAPLWLAISQKAKSGVGGFLCHYLCFGELRLRSNSTLSPFSKELLQHYIKRKVNLGNKQLVCGWLGVSVTCRSDHQSSTYFLLSSFFLHLYWQGNSCTWGGGNSNLSHLCCKVCLFPTSKFPK